LETSVRLLRLLSLLQAQPDWSGAELADRLGVTTRTVRNDIERLHILGYQVRSTTGPAGGYRLTAGAALPPLLLDDEEAIAVAVGLHAAAGGTVTGIEEASLRALTKLRQLLPSRLGHRTDALRAAIDTVAGRGPTVDAETLAVIAAAIRDRERLRFDYLDHDGTASRRSAEPHRLVFTGRRWYLLAWDDDRDDWRTFRADRIPGGDAAAHVVRGAGSTAWPHPATVRLHAPAEALAERLPPAAGLLQPDGEHASILETGSDSLYDLVAFLSSLEVDFTVIDPPELRQVLHTLAGRYLAATRQPGA
jgi:predicted DNA-binding transcriptional regulator YafY